MLTLLQLLKLLWGFAVVFHWSLSHYCGPLETQLLPLPIAQSWSHSLIYLCPGMGAQSCVPGNGASLTPVCVLSPGIITHPTQTAHRSEGLSSLKPVLKVWKRLYLLQMYRHQCKIIRNKKNQGDMTLPKKKNKI